MLSSQAQVHGGFCVWTENLEMAKGEFLRERECCMQLVRFCWLQSKVGHDEQLVNKVQGLVLFSCVGQLLDRKCKARQDWFYGRRIVDWMLCQCRARLGFDV